MVLLVIARKKAVYSVSLPGFPQYGYFNQQFPKEALINTVLSKGSRDFHGFKIQ
jgi:hypothetical protein